MAGSAKGASLATLLRLAESESLDDVISALARRAALRSGEGSRGRGSASGPSESSGGKKISSQGLARFSLCGDIGRFFRMKFANRLVDP